MTDLPSPIRARPRARPADESRAGSRAGSRTGSRPGSAAARLLACTALIAAGAAAPAGAGPKGGAVKAGGAVITSRGAVTRIRQTTDRVVIDWDNFDIDAHETARFVQPDRKAIALNRVTGEAPTRIRGALKANGSVWLLNRSGVVFHEGARVDVGGLLATTSDISDDAFMAGGRRFDRPGKPGARVVNRGEISFADAGYAALVAPGAENRGRISGALGKVIVAGRETFAFDVTGEGILALAPPRGATWALNAGEIASPGGLVSISAADAAAALESLVTVGGTVSAPTRGAAGGRVETAGGRVTVTGDVSAAGGADARGGAVALRGAEIDVASGARIDASGGTGGGVVEIGGARRGAGRDLARRVILRPGATVRADATLDGDGGSITLWSREGSWFLGDASARGGPGGGDGGFLEVSSLGHVDMRGGVDLGAAAGAAGTVLIDPDNITITDPGGAAGGATGGPDIFASDPPADVTLNVDYVNNLAAGTTLVLEALLDITVDAPLAPTNADVGLTMHAGRDLTVNASIAATGPLRLRAGADVFVNASVFSPGVLQLEAGAGLAASGAPSPQADGSVIIAGAASRIEVDGGALDVNVGAAGALETQTGTGLTPGLLRSGAAFALPDSDFAPLTRIETTNADLTQDAGAAIVAGGRLELDLGTGDAVLANAGNDFGAVQATAGDLDLRDGVDGVNLRVVDLSGTLDVRAAGDIGDIAGAGRITTGGAAALTSDSGSVILDETGAHSFGGPVSATGADVTLSALGDIRLADVTTLGGGGTDGDLTVSAGGTIRDTAATPMSVLGATTLTAGTGAGDDIILDRAAHDFGAAGTVLGDDLGAVNASAGGEIRLQEDNEIRLGAIDAGGVLSVTAGVTMIDADGSAIRATGITELLARQGDIVLDNGLHDFGRTDLRRVDAEAETVFLSDANDIRLGDVLAFDGLTTVARGTILDTDGRLIEVVGDASFTAQLANGTRRDIVLDGEHRLERVSALGEDIVLSIGLESEGDFLDVTLLDIDAVDSGGDPAAAAAGFDENLTVLAHGAILTEPGSDVNVADDARIQALDYGPNADVSDHTYFDVDLTQGAIAFGGPVSAVGQTVAIDSGAALSVADSYAVASADFVSTGAVTLRRVFVGTETALAGPTLTIDAPAPLRVEAGGAVDAQDIRASVLTLGGPGTTQGAAAAVAGDLRLSRFSAVDAHTGFATGVATLESGAASGVLDFGGGNGLRLVNLDFLGGGPTTLSAVGSLTVSGLRGTDVTLSGAEVRTGYIEATGALVVTSAGDIRTLDDVDLAAIAPGAITVQAPNRPEQETVASAIVEDVSLAGIAPFERLVSVAGTTTLTAGGDVTLIHTSVDAPSAAPGEGTHNDFVGAVTVAGAASAALEDANDLIIGGLTGAPNVAGQVTLRAGSDPDEAGSITQTGAIAADGDAAFIAGDALGGGILGDVTLDRADNAFARVQVLAVSATLRDGDGFDIADSRLSGDLTVQAPSAADPQAGDVTLTDVVVGGTLSADVAGDLSAQRVIAALTDAAAGGALSFEDFRSGAATLDAGADMRVERFSTDAAAFAAGGDMTLRDGAAAGDATGLAGGFLDLSNLVVSGAGTFRGAGAQLRQIEIDGALSLFADGGSAALGPIRVGGDAAVQAAGGDVFTLDAIQPTVRDFVIAGPLGATIGENVSAALGNAETRGRIVETHAAEPDLGVSGRAALSRPLEVGGDALLIASAGADGGGAIAVTRDADGRANLIDGATALFADGDAALEVEGAIVIGRSATLRPDGGAFAPGDPAASAGGDMALRSNAANAASGSRGISQTGAIETVGRLTAATGLHVGAVDRAALADVSLSLAGNDFGVVSGLARNLRLRDDDGMTARDLRALADAGGQGGGIVIGTGAEPQGGDLRLGDIVAEGALSANAAGGIDGDDAGRDHGRIAALGLTARAGGDVSFTDLAIAGDALIDAGGGVTLDRAATLSDLRLRARAGDIALGAISVGGGLGARADLGSIATRDSAAAAGDLIAGARARGAGDPLGVDASGILGATAPDGRVTLTLDAGPSGPALTALLDIAGGAAFDAGGDVLAAPEAASIGGLTNSFAGGVSAAAGGSVHVEDAGALLIGAAGAPSLPGGGEVAAGIAAGGDVRLIAAGGDLFAADGAVFAVDGGLTASATGSVALTGLAVAGGVEAIGAGGVVDLSGADLSGGVSAFADIVSIASDTDVALGRVLASDLTVLADLDGGGGRAMVVDLAEGETGFAPTRIDVRLDTVGGAARIAPGEADPLPLTGRKARAWRDIASVVATDVFSIGHGDARSGPAEARREILLDNPANSFGPRVDIRNERGATTLTEELASLPASVARLVARSAADQELLALTGFVAGGDVRIATADQVQVHSALSIAADTTFSIDASAGGRPILFLESVDAAGPGATLELAAGAGGDVIFFGTVGRAGPLGAVEIASARHILAGARPEFLTGAGGAAGASGAPRRIAQDDLDAFAADLGVGTDPGPLGDVAFFVDSAIGPEDYFLTDRLEARASGDIRFLISIEAAGAFSAANEFYGVFIGNGFSFGGAETADGGTDLPDSIEMYGAISDDRSRAASLRPTGPYSLDYLFNGCVIGDVGSCVTLGPEILVPQVVFTEPPAFEVDSTDLTELFGAFGNEDLWRLPQSFTDDPSDRDEEPEQTEQEASQ